MTQALSERQQRAVERISEDESLTEDLTDEPARMLLDWTSKQASALAGDAARSDEQVSEALKELRKAVRTAATSGETDGAKLIALAEAALAKAIKPPAESSTNSAAQAPSVSDSGSEQVQVAPVSQNPKPQPVTIQDAHVESVSATHGGAQQAHATSEPEASDKAPKQQTTEGQLPDRQGEQQTHKESKPHLQLLRVPDPPPPKASLETRISAPSEDALSEEERYQLWLDDVMEED